MNAFTSLAGYSSVQYQSEADATPHRFIQMLFEGALERIAQAKGAIAEEMYEVKGERINKAIDIVAGLRGCLNDREGGELASNLDSLYDYIIRRLFEANAENNVEILDQVAELIGDIKQAWDGIESQVND